MMKIDKLFPRVAVVALLTMGVAVTVALADDDEDERGGYSQSQGGRYGGEDLGRQLMPGKVDAKWQQECSACHIPYAPGLLPAESWRKVMAGLDQHFGADASLDAQDATEITAFLVNNASTRWSSKNAPLRITDSAWFKSKHNSREVSPAVWKNPKVKGPANCQACHSGAERGDFNEDNVKVPR